MTMKLKELRMHLMTLLSTMNATGYDLTKLMENSHIWRSSHQQTYRSLNQLHDIGYLSLKLEPQQGKPDRKVYSVTAKGHAAFETELRETKPKITAQHGIRTIMLNLGNREYFEQLFDLLEQAIDATAAEIKRTTCPIERLAMKRENYLHHAEMEFCSEALNYLEQTTEPQKAAA